LFPRFFRATGSGQIGPICPRRKIWETFFANTLSFPGTKIFRKKMSAQLDLSLKNKDISEKGDVSCVYPQSAIHALGVKKKQKALSLSAEETAHAGQPSE
jgi:hypothetical protein